MVDRNRTPVTALVNFTNSIIPHDDTIPQNTEGTQVATVTITPKTIGNLIRVRAQVMFAVDVGPRQVIVAVFVSGQANALAGMSKEAIALEQNMISVEGEFTATATSLLTFELRIGVNTGGGSFMLVNGESSVGNRRLGGAAGTFIEVEEFTS